MHLLPVLPAHDGVLRAQAIHQQVRNHQSRLYDEEEPSNEFSLLLLFKEAVLKPQTHCESASALTSKSLSLASSFSFLENVFSIMGGCMSFSAQTSLAPFVCESHAKCPSSAFFLGAEAPKKCFYFRPAHHYGIIMVIVCRHLHQKHALSKNMSLRTLNMLTRCYIAEFSALRVDNET